MDVSGKPGNPVDGTLVAVVAAVCAAYADEHRQAGTEVDPKGMPVWKRAALAELVNAGTDIRDFI
ncbi:MAG: hypothetical protein M0Z41_08405 [Peptococcaceae bacterium]|nr:hypothetical protein [Peptococcaceae bacterium]